MAASRIAALLCGLGLLVLCPAALASFAYVTNSESADNTVSQYAVAGDGTLSTLTPATVLTGREPAAVVLSRDGTHAYVTNLGSDTVSQYAVTAHGTLTPLTPATVPTGSEPKTVIISLDGAHAYVTNEGSWTVSQYVVAVNGTLSPLTPATVPTGRTPYVVVLSPDGKHASSPTRRATRSRNTCSRPTGRSAR